MLNALQGGLSRMNFTAKPKNTGDIPGDDELIGGSAPTSKREALERDMLQQHSNQLKAQGAIENALGDKDKGSQRTRMGEQVQSNLNRTSLEDTFKRKTQE